VTEETHRRERPGAPPRRRIPFPLTADDPLELLDRGERDAAFDAIERLIVEPERVNAWIAYIEAVAAAAGRAPATAVEPGLRPEACEAIVAAGVREAVLLGRVDVGELEDLLRSPEALFSLHFDALSRPDSYFLQRLEHEASEILEPQSFSDADDLGPDALFQILKGCMPALTREEFDRGYAAHLRGPKRERAIAGGAEAVPAAKRATGPQGARSDEALAPPPALVLTLSSVTPSAADPSSPAPWNAEPWEAAATASFGDSRSDMLAFREGLEPAERADLRWYLEEFHRFPEGGHLTRAKRVLERLDRFGRELIAPLAQLPEAARWLEAVRAAGRGRLELRAQSRGDEVALRSPWELLRLGDGALLADLGVSVVRRTAEVRPPRPRQTASKRLRVLVVTSRPSDSGFLDHRVTPRAVLDVLETRGDVELVFLRPPTFESLRDELQRARSEGQPYEIFHFDGHGGIRMDPHTGSPEVFLAFETGPSGKAGNAGEPGKLDPVGALDLGAELRSASVPCAVLEACRSASELVPGAHLAAEILRSGVACVLAMSHSVHLDMTRELSRGLYEAIGRGLPFSAAVACAQERARRNRGRRVSAHDDAAAVEIEDWFAAQLYQGVEDPVLLPAASPAEAKGAVRDDGEGSSAPGARRPLLDTLPPPPRGGFQGRGLELHALERAVRANPCVVLHAPGGSGKIALAREAAEWWVRSGLFKDGAVFVSLEGGLSAEGVLARAGEALEGFEFHKHPPEARLRDLIADRAVLFILDNFESVLPAFGGRPEILDGYARLAGVMGQGDSRVLITSRDWKVPVEGVHGVPVLGLPEDEGAVLLKGLLEALGLSPAEREERGLTGELLRALSRATFGHPLSLELISSPLAELGAERTLRELSELLRSAEQEHPEPRNRSLAASFAFSGRHLDPEARAVLPTLALIAGGAPEEAARRVAGLDELEWRRARQALVRAGLVQVFGPFLRPSPALEEAAGVEVPEEMAGRFIEVFLAFAMEGYQKLRSPEAQTAMVYLGSSEAAFRRALREALGRAQVKEAFCIADTLRMYLELSGRAAEGGRLMEELSAHAGTGSRSLTDTQIRSRAAVARAAAEPDGALRDLEALLASARGREEPEWRFERARIAAEVARVLDDRLYRSLEALPFLDEAERNYKSLEDDGEIDSANRSAVLGDRANALNSLGRFDEALAAAEETLLLHRARGDLSAEARGVGRCGHILWAAGKTAEARRRYEEALDLVRLAGDVGYQGTVLHALGTIARDQGDFHEAASRLRMAHAAFHRAGDGRGEARVLNTLGNVEQVRGDLEAAVSWYARSLESFRALGDLQGEASARSNRAIALSKQIERSRDSDQARRLLNEAIAEGRAALEMYGRFHDPVSIATSENNLAAILLRAGQLEKAEALALRALATWERLRHPDRWQTLWILEYIATARGDAALAAEYRDRKEEAHREAQDLSARLDPRAVPALVGVALQARARGLALSDALAAAGLEDPESALRTIVHAEPWLHAHLTALAEGRPRPSADPPAAFRELLDDAWAAAEGEGEARPPPLTAP
jgi:tetratricopeptide (TPR) repeat protein